MRNEKKQNKSGDPSSACDPNCFLSRVDDLRTGDEKKKGFARIFFLSSLIFVFFFSICEKKLFFQEIYFSKCETQ